MIRNVKNSFGCLYLPPATDGASFREKLFVGEYFMSDIQNGSSNHYVHGEKKPRESLRNSNNIYIFQKGIFATTHSEKISFFSTSLWKISIKTPFLVGEVPTFNNAGVFVFSLDNFWNIIWFSNVSENFILYIDFFFNFVELFPFRIVSIKFIFFNYFIMIWFVS